MISFTINKYRYYEENLDEVSLYVQECGGHYEIQRYVIEFFVPVEYRDFIIMKYPFLQEVAYVY
jgi:hypothetical protein